MAPAAMLPTIVRRTLFALPIKMIFTFEKIFKLQK
jgi:hypothetical protein